MVEHYQETAFRQVLFSVSFQQLRIFTNILNFSFLYGEITKKSAAREDQYTLSTTVHFV